MQYSTQSSWINQKENLFVIKTSSVVIFFACAKGKVSVKLPGCWCGVTPFVLILA